MSFSGGQPTLEMNDALNYSANYYSELEQLQRVCSHVLSVPNDWNKPYSSPSDDDLLMTELRGSGYSITPLLEYNSESVLRFCARRQHSLREQDLAFLSQRIEENLRDLGNVEWRIQEMNRAVESSLEFDKLLENSEAADVPSEGTPEGVAAEMKALAFEIIRGRASFSDFEARFSPLEILEPLRRIAGNTEYFHEEIEAMQSIANAIAGELEQLRREHRTVETTRMISY